MPHLHIIQQFDSGFGIQIPTKFLEQIGVHGNGDVEICCRADIVVIRKPSSQYHELNESPLNTK